MLKLIPAILLIYLSYSFPERGNKLVNQQSEVDQLTVDGPYVMYRGRQVFVSFIDKENGIRSVRTESFRNTDRGKIRLIVPTDEPGKTFTVKLHEKQDDEPSEYSGKHKIFALSDIEGNFRAFRKLLQANHIIDNDFNWTFGKGHLVLTGDFFDRGHEVTQVLWLIYMLEDKARKEGGYVHFILGNHEVMNLSGDIRYVHPDYIYNAGLMKERYVELYGTRSELGRWLRTKNITEKIGDFLFAHGGISGKVNALDISVNKINKIARPYYDDSTYQYPDIKTELMFSVVGPFWYRGYYMGKRSENEITSKLDSTLEIYKVKHIVTGHTVIADTISVLNGGKLINTDVHHAGGHSEALLVEDGKFYRVDGLGQKFRIY
ncbi:MAG TPA: metallophosphoesterase [Chitinophagaceae bacterium]|nr:metallophosphoesterase [Chitinophagaceae bacterium]MCB9056378.1 metallophosphoesterase [Chitinophagales bacterium]HPG11462.1 metallophosphoesterase [Chitinophagaceae bacterium]